MSLLVVLASPAWPSSVLMVCADEASRNVKDDLTEVLSSGQNVVKVAGPKAPATACLAIAAGSRRQECFATAGGAANVQTLLLVSTSAKGSALTITFEALAATDGKQQRREVLRTTPARLKVQAAPVLKRLIAPVAGKPKAAPLSAGKTPVIEREPDQLLPIAQVDKPVPGRVPDRPQQVELAPSASSNTDSTAELIAATPAKRTSNGGAWVATGTAVAAAAVAGTFAGLGFSNQAQVERTTNGVSPLTYSQAQGLQSTSNMQLTVALAAGIAAGVSGGLAAILWSRN